MIAPPQPPKYVLRLYVAGASARSREALLHVRRLCEVELQGRCDLQVIDVHRQPELARDAEVIATPTLVKEAPAPARRFFGNLEDTAAILAGLGLQAPAPGRGEAADRSRPHGAGSAGDDEPLESEGGSGS